jgi:hypothetical protein
MSLLDLNINNSTLSLRSIVGKLILWILVLFISLTVFAKCIQILLQFQSWDAWLDSLKYFTLGAVSSD